MIKHIENKTHFVIIDKVELSKGKYTDGLIIGNYSHLYELKSRPVFACLTGGNGTISERTRQKNGLVYIPVAVLRDCSKIKIVRGKRADYQYEIWRNIRFENENAFTCEITRYNRSGEINELTTKTA